MPKRGNFNTTINLSGKRQARWPLDDHDNRSVTVTTRDPEILKKNALSISLPPSLSNRIQTTESRRHTDNKVTERHGDVIGLGAVVIEHKVGKMPSTEEEKREKRERCFLEGQEDENATEGKENTKVRANINNTINNWDHRLKIGPRTMTSIDSVIHVASSIKSNEVIERWPRLLSFF